MVAAHLHMDEKTPHIHAAVVPIVTGERRKAKKEQADGKRKYRKKTNSVRLCADDLFNRQTLDRLPRQLRKGDGEIRIATWGTGLGSTAHHHHAVLSGLEKEE